MGLRYGWYRDHHNARLEVQVAGETVAYFPGKGSEFTPLGKAFYVDERSGSDDYNGLSPQTAKATITAALGLCTTNLHDYIFVLNCWATASVTIDKSDIRLIGISNGNFDGGNDLYGSANNSYGLYLNPGKDLELAGFNLSSTGTSGVALECAETYRAHIHHCTFGCNRACTTGIKARAAGGSFTHSTIEDCLFGTLITGNSMYISLNTSIVRRNRFLETAGVCISVPSTLFANTIVEDNRFLVDDGANGDAITIPSAGTTNMICNNYAMNGMLNAGYSYNPYKDLAANTSNHWSMNYRGNSVIEPVGA